MIIDPITAEDLLTVIPPDYREHHLLPDQSPDYDEIDGASVREGWVGTPVKIRIGYLVVSLLIGVYTTMILWWVVRSPVVLTLGLIASVATSVFVSLVLDGGLHRLPVWWRIYRRGST